MDEQRSMTSKYYERNVCNLLTVYIQYTIAQCTNYIISKRFKNKYNKIGKEELKQYSVKLKWNKMWKDVIHNEHWNTKFCKRIEYRIVAIVKELIHAN